MHPSIVRAFVSASVDDLRSRVGARPELRVAAIDLDLDRLELDVEFDHDEHETEVVPVASPLLLPGGQQLTRQQNIPILGRSRTRRLDLRFGLDGYDLLAPTAELRDEHRQPLPASTWPTAVAGGGIVNDHPLFKRPFFCRRGLREFHTHEQHEDTPWAAWRDGLPLHAIVLELLEDLRVRWHGAAA